MVGFGHIGGGTSGDSTSMDSAGYSWYGGSSKNAAGGMTPARTGKGGELEGVGWGEMWHAAWHGSLVGPAQVKTDVYGTVFAAAVAIGPVGGQPSSTGSSGGGRIEGSRPEIPSTLHTPTLTKILPMPLPAAVHSSATTSPEHQHHTKTASDIAPATPATLGVDANSPPFFGSNAAAASSGNRTSAGNSQGGESGFMTYAPPTFLVCWHWQQVSADPPPSHTTTPGLFLALDCLSHPSSLLYRS